MSKPDCKTSKETSELTPGQTYEIEVVVIGHKIGVAPTIVHVE